MSTTDELRALRERVRAATGPDASMDAAFVAIQHNAIVRAYPPSENFGPSAKWQFWSRDGEHFLGNETNWPLSPVTASLDAALALVQRMLPGTMWATGSMEEGPFCQLVVPAKGGGYSGGNVRAFHGTAPQLAVLDALLLAALIAQQEPTHD